MVIDSHQHFWKYDPIRDNWIDSSMEAIRRDFLPEDLFPVLQENNVDGCIAVQADQSIEESEFLLNLAANNSFIKGVVGWVDLCSDKIEDQLKKFASNTKFCGVRHICQSESKGFMLRKDFQNGMRLLAKYDLTYDILVFHYQLEEVLMLVEKFPNQKFVIDHIAKPNIKEAELIEWQGNLERIAKHNNVFCKISGMVTETNFTTWSIDEFTPYLNVVVNSFGTDRLMYGSDWPVCLLAAQYQEQKSIVSIFFETYSKEVQQKIFGLNAVRFYGI